MSLNDTREQRLYRVDWGANSDPVYFPNNDGISLACVAGNDQSGGFILTPQGGSPLANQPITVTARSPMVFPLPARCPFLVGPLWPQDASSTYIHTLDAYFYRCCPPFAPKRADFRDAQLLSATGSSAVRSVFGRDVIDFVIRVAWTSGTVALNIFGLNYGISAGATPLQRTLWTATGIAATTVYTYSLNSVNQPDTPASGERVPKFDMVYWSCTISNTASVSVVMTARDL
jgi:hypothetical protein